MAYMFTKTNGEGYSSNLSLFKNPSTDTATQKITYHEYRPARQITKGSTIEFLIAGTSNNYLDLSKTRLRLKARILKENGDIINEPLVGFVNLPLQSLFRQVDLSLQQQVVCPNVGSHYPHRAMIDVLLNTSEGQQETVLQSQCFHKDTSSQMDTVSPANQGFFKRARYTGKSEVLAMEGPLYLDMTTQDRLLLNGVEVGLTLYPSSDAFCLMGPNEQRWQVEIMDAALRICHVTVNPGVILGHAEAMKKTPAMYPLLKSDIRSFTIPSGSYSFVADDVFQGQIPTELMVAMTSAAAFSGSYSKNPFNFQHFNANFVSFEVDNVSVPGRPLQPDFKKENYVDAYLSLFETTDNTASAGNLISRSDYKNGYCIFRFPISPTNQKEFLSLIQKGHSRLTIKFEEPLQEAVTVLLYAKFQSLLEIDQARNVIV